MLWCTTYTRVCGEEMGALQAADTYVLHLYISHFLKWLQFLHSLAVVFTWLYYFKNILYFAVVI